jgi:hypothetical protein
MTFSCTATSIYIATRIRVKTKITDIQNTVNSYHGKNVTVLLEKVFKSWLGDEYCGKYVLTLLGSPVLPLHWYSLSQLRLRQGLLRKRYHWCIKILNLKFIVAK